MYMALRHSGLHLARDVGQGFSAAILGVHTYIWSLVIHVTVLAVIGVLLLLLREIAPDAIRSSTAADVAPPAGSRPHPSITAPDAIRSSTAADVAPPAGSRPHQSITAPDAIRSSTAAGVAPPAGSRGTAPADAAPSRAGRFAMGLFVVVVAANALQAFASTGPPPFRPG